MKQGRLLESLETILVVSVITALIWLYAEGETISAQTKTVKVNLVPPTAGLIVSIPGQEPSETGVQLSVEASIQASRGNWARITDWVRRETVDIEVSDPGDSATKEQIINLHEALNQSTLADINAFIKEVEPATISVRVQQLKDVPMGINAERGSLELSEREDEEPKFNPDTVPVKMTAEMAQQVRDQDLKLIARLDLLDPNALLEDTQNVATVQLDLPPELKGKPFIKLQRQRADVTFVVRKLTEELTLPRVQVRLNITDDITGKYRIRIDPESQRILQVTLRGPTKAIRLIEQDPSLVRASITIKMEDLRESLSNTAPLDIFPPEGVKVVSTDPQLTTITYTATELTAQP